MTNLEAHAERELRTAGLFDKDSDYEGMIGEAVLALVKVFAEQGHSGFSANLTLKVFDQVAHFKCLTGLTDNPDEWMQVSPDIMPNGDLPVWQSLRQCSCFSNDGGKTFYDIDAGDGRALKTSAKYEAK